MAAKVYRRNVTDEEKGAETEAAAEENPLPPTLDDDPASPQTQDPLANIIPQR